MIRTFRMLITKSLLPHIRKFYRPFAGSIHEPVTTDGMKFRSCDDLCKLLHVRWLNVDNVEALILDVQVPQVYSQVVRRNESLPVAVHGYAVNVVGMRIGVHPPWHCCHNGIVVRHAGEFQIGHGSEVVVWISDGATAIGVARPRRRQL